MDKIDIKIDGETKVLEIRQGSALPLQEPRVVNVVGNIDSPSLWLESAKKIDCNAANALVDNDAGTIVLTLDENSHYASKITGNLKESEDAGNLGLNSSKVWNLSSLANFIRMNRAVFESKEVAMKLVTTLRTFTGKINQKIEKHEDDRANRKIRFEQEVENNVPDGFKVNIPIFKGWERQTISVEIVMQVDGAEVVIYLISPDFAETYTMLKDEAITKEVEKLQAKGVVVINV